MIVPITMCRFLLLHTTNEFDPSGLFLSFAETCRKSRSVDGEGQRDGWGIAWLRPEETWAMHKSLRPIWEDAVILADTPRSRAYAIHARSASFDKDRHEIAYNQPYVNGDTVFTFNGLLRGVKLQRRVAGDIGAQRIWNLVLSEMGIRPTAEAMATADAMLTISAREILACNIALIDRSHIYAVCRYTRDPDYYQLRSHTGADLRMVCSEPVEGYAFDDIPVGRVMTL